MVCRRKRGGARNSVSLGPKWRRRTHERRGAGRHGPSHRLEQWRGAARTRLIETVYGELRRLARGYLQRERRDHSLPPTALVHETYMKLVDRGRVRWQNRAQFFAIAAHQMRRILADQEGARTTV